MNPDLSPILSEWPYEPGKVNARFIDGPDGEVRLQIRLDLGILQLLADGRPDGQNPNGFPSLLEYFEALADRSENQESTEHEPEGPTDSAEKPEPLKLTEDDCRELREEAAQYYQRYVACLALEDYERVMRDTSRNLRVLDLCSKYAENEEDRTVLEQFRPYITVVRARAQASLALKDKEPRAAVIALDEALEQLKGYFSERGQMAAFESSNEVRLLRGLRESLVPKLPMSQRAELKQRLADAINAENYELAAILRDELKHLPE